MFTSLASYARSRCTGRRSQQAVFWQRWYPTQLALGKNPKLSGGHFLMADPSVHSENSAKNVELLDAADVMPAGYEKQEKHWLGGRLFRPGSQFSVTSAGSIMSLTSEHATRLARRDIQLIEERAEALEHHHLAPPPEQKPTAHPPLKEMLRNLWVLAIMVGILAIIIVAKGRIHVKEPLEGVHATNGVVPFVMPLDNDYVNYLFINLLIGPYFPPDATGSGGSGHRRRLASWVGEAVAAQSSGARMAGHAGAVLASDVRQLLSKPKLMVAQRYRRRLLVEGREGRRLLVQGPSEEPASDEVQPELPELKVVLMQRNASSAAEPLTNVQQYTFLPVSEAQLCTTKDGNAVKCSMNFRASDFTDAHVEGEPLYLGFEATQVTQLVFQAEVSELGGLGPAKNWIALTIVALAVLAIASERIHRMWCAMLGASFMLALLLWMNMTPSLGTIVTWLDESTLALLFGMMIIVGRLKDTGMFELLSAWAVKLSRGRMWLLSTMLMVTTGFVSAWLDNVTTMLLMAPISISIMQQCGKDPVPLLMSQVLLSNIGGAATMVGDPPALIIGNALSNYLGFMDFIANMAPGVLMACAACIPLLLFIFRTTLVGRVDGYGAVVEEVNKFRIRDWRLMAKCSYVAGIVIVGFLLHPVHHCDPAWFAVLGAIVLCVCDQPMEVENVVKSVEWDMLLFFAGMFVMIEASAEVGMIRMIGGWLESAIRATPEGSRTIVAIQILLWASMLISAMLDNIPYTITMVPVIEYMASAGLGLDLQTLAWALNFGACFGGNATLIGASANIVTATLADRAGIPITFVAWLKSGVPIAVVSVAMADVWMILRFCL